MVITSYPPGIDCLRNIEDCHKACEAVYYVLHLDALDRVPRSLAGPITNKFEGFLDMAVAARGAELKSFTYAARSSTYGDHPGLPKMEDVFGKPLSPYAFTKYVNGLYAYAFARCYRFATNGLRYFNVFGRRQDPDGACAAVIPKWTAAMSQGDNVFVNGDAVQANLIAASTADGAVRNPVCNVGVGAPTSLKQFFGVLRKALAGNGMRYEKTPVQRNFRDGSVCHSQADIEKAHWLLSYTRQIDIQTAISAATPWYVLFIGGNRS